MRIMIQNLEGKKTTPKRFAQEIVKEALASLQASWQIDGRGLSRRMTDRELELVESQIEKLCERIKEKMCSGKNS